MATALEAAAQRATMFGAHSEPSLCKLPTRSRCASSRSRSSTPIAEIRKLREGARVRKRWTHGDFSVQGHVTRLHRTQPLVIVAASSKLRLWKVDTRRVESESNALKITLTRSVDEPTNDSEIVGVFVDGQDEIPGSALLDVWDLDLAGWCRVDRAKPKSQGNTERTRVALRVRPKTVVEVDVFDAAVAMLRAVIQLASLIDQPDRMWIRVE